MINVQTVTDDISWQVTSCRENTRLILIDHTVKIIEGCYRNVILYNNSCLLCVKSQVSSSYFNRTMPGNTGRMRQSTFVPITLPDVDQF